ncbi:Protein shisa-6, partial [Nestor notabilis]
SLTGFRYCCGTCFYRFCCNKRAEKLDQSLCRNYKSPEWAHPTTASGVLPADGRLRDGSQVGHVSEDQAPIVPEYIHFNCLDSFYDCGSENAECHSKYCVKITSPPPPPPFSLPRALADILRQQGPIPIAHCERETISAIDTSPKENTPVRTSSKNHYTPVRTSKSNPG